MNLSIVVPVYNEELNLGDAVQEIIAGVPSAVTDYELLIVDDGSSDNTGRIMRDLAAEHPGIRTFRHDTNQGKGAALASGFGQARMDWILFLDADLQIPMAVLPDFLDAARSAGMVIGYRVDRRDHPARRLLSKGFAMVAAWTLGLRVRDINCPFKLFRKTIVDGMALHSRGFLVDAELLYKAGKTGIRPIELPVPCRPRRQGASTVRMHHAVETLNELIALLRRK